MRKAIIIGISVIALVVVALIFAPPYDPVSPRHASAVILISFGGARVSIAKYGEHHGTLVGSGNGVQVQTSNHELALNTAVITPDGVLVGYNNHFGVVVVLVPRLKHGKVEWTCSAMPASAAPAVCRA